MVAQINIKSSPGGPSKIDDAVSMKMIPNRIYVGGKKLTLKYTMQQGTFSIYRKNTFLGSRIRNQDALFLGVGRRMHKGCLMAQDKQMALYSFCHVM